jgi:hypothetical protein
VIQLWTPVSTRIVIGARRSVKTKGDVARHSRYRSAGILPIVENPKTLVEWSANLT